MFIYLQRCPILLRFLVVLFFLHTVFIASVKATQAGEEKVTIVAKNVPLRDVFKSITKQTGYHLFYSPEVVNVLERVSLEVKQQPVDDVLQSLLGNKNLTWVYNEDAIAIRVKEKSPDEKKRIDRIEDDSITNPLPQTVTGKVTDANGNAIPGATVMVKGTREGATADAEGKFTLHNVKNRSVLVISSIGYEARELTVKGKSILAQLNMDVQALDETVVIAYGTTSQRLSTGNIATVKAEEIERQPVNNPLLALQGRVPGLFIQQSTGLPGTAVRVQVQGQNSILNGNDPLYVIDGVPYSSQSLPNLGAILAPPNGQSAIVGNNPLGFINPADIESITVLKDADATSIYGSRAANGAILITTKKGKAGDTRVSINMQKGWGKVPRKLDLLNRDQYLEMRHEALRNDSKTISPTDYDLNGTWDTLRSTDWQKELIGKAAAYFDVQASVSGGNDNTQYLIGSGFHRETTVFPGDFSDQKGSVHFNINNKSKNQKFKVQLSGSYLIDNNHLPNQDLTSYAVQLAPVAPKLYLPDGTLNWQTDGNGKATWENPLRYTLTKYHNKTTNLTSNGMLSYTIIPGLDISTSMGYTNMQSSDKQLTGMNYYRPEDRPFNIPIGVYGSYNINSWIVEPQINLKRQFGPGRIDALLGSTIQQTNSNSQQLIGGGFANDLLLEDIKSASILIVSSTLDQIYKYNALFGRLNYNLFDKYIVNLAARRDGSSRFGPENRFHNFYSVAGAWIFSKENFLKNNVSFLSFGKVRASYGTTGSDQIQDYRYINLYNKVNSDLAYLGGTGLEPASLYNPYLQWEETRKLQLGLDIGLLGDRILLNTNYIRNRSSNQLLDYPLPGTTGFNGIARNLPATVENSAWEFTVNTVNTKSRNLTWSMNFNITLPKNKLHAFPNIEQTSYASSYIVGEPITFINRFHFLGVDKTTGLYIFENRKGDQTSSPSKPDDQIVRINTSPKFYGGLQNSFTYKRFNLTFLLQFVKQRAQDIDFGISLPGAFFSLGNQPITVVKRWKQVNDNSNIQRYNSDYSRNTPYFNAVDSDMGYGDASFIRLKNLSLSYQLAETLSRQIRLNNLRIYAQAQNILTFTNYKGLDPETRSSLTLPSLRVFTVGFQANL